MEEWFVISRQQDLASGSETKSQTLRTSCGRKFITVKKTEKGSDTDIRRGMESAPSLVLARELYTFPIDY